MEKTAKELIPTILYIPWYDGGDDEETNGEDTSSAATIESNDNVPNDKDQQSQFIKERESETTVEEIECLLNITRECYDLSCQLILRYLPGRTFLNRL